MKLTSHSLKYDACLVGTVRAKAIFPDEYKALLVVAHAVRLELKGTYVGKRTYAPAKLVFIWPGPPETA